MRKLRWTRLVFLLHLAGLPGLSAPGAPTAALDWPGTGTPHVRVRLVAGHGASRCSAWLAGLLSWVTQLASSRSSQVAEHCAHQTWRGRSPPRR